MAWESFSPIGWCATMRKHFLHPGVDQTKATSDRSRACRQSRPDYTGEVILRRKCGLSSKLSLGFEGWSDKVSARSVDVRRWAKNVCTPGSIGQDDGRSILHVGSPGDVHTGGETLPKKRCLSPELELKVESQKKRKKDSCAAAVDPMPNVRRRCVAKAAKPGDRRSIDCAMRWIPFRWKFGEKKFEISKLWTVVTHFNEVLE